ncbi:MAG TPA: hypothetical protein VJA47_00885 [archaeon]|nr:hypothetical protein [archaeon]
MKGALKEMWWLIIIVVAILILFVILWGFYSGWIPKMVGGLGTVFGL